MRFFINNKRIILLALVCLSFFFVFSTKIFVSLFLIYFLVSFFIFDESIEDIVFDLLLISLFFNVSIRNWEINTIFNHTEDFNQGYRFLFSFDVTLIFSVLSFLLILKKKIIKSKKELNSHGVFLWILTSFLFFALISTVFSPSFYLSWLGFIQLLVGAVIFIYSLLFFNKKKNKDSFIILLLSLAFFISYIGFIQFTQQKPTEFFFDTTKYATAFGYFTTDGKRVFRSSGHLSHPTYYGSFLSIIYPVIIACLVKATQKTKGIFMKLASLSTLFFMSSVAILATYSKSAWLSVALSFGIILSQKEVKLTIVKFFKKYQKYLPFIFVIASSIIIYFFSFRISSFIESFSGGGNTRGRIALMKKAVYYTLDKPLLGIGLNRFTVVLDSGFIPPELEAFIYPVHNTFLLFASELGIPAAISFLYFYIFIMYKSFPIAKKNLVNLSIWIGSLTFFINSQLHTLFNQDPTYYLLMVFLAYLSSLILGNEKRKMK